LTDFVNKLPATGQPTKPTQPSIPLGSLNDMDYGGGQTSNVTYVLIRMHIYNQTYSIMLYDIITHNIMVILYKFKLLNVMALSLSKLMAMP